METIIFAFVLILVAIGGLTLGVMAGRPPLKGSCGGLACVQRIDCGTCKARAKLEQKTGELP